MIRALRPLGASLCLAFALPFAVCALTGGTFIEVKGISMKPVYSFGDIVFAMPIRLASDLRVGQIVVVHPSQAGTEHYTGSSLLVGDYVHRIIQISRDGSITTRGDNNTVSDPGHVTAKDLLGTAEVPLPGAFAWLFRFLESWEARIGLGLVAVACLVVRPRAPKARHGKFVDERMVSA